ncbi:MAG: hypothetical protein Q4G30_00820 [Actinomycetaceae bacterium]|nr:hypothetical protein [Actinomycetaceae bacterium]
MIAPLLDFETVLEFPVSLPGIFIYIGNLTGPIIVVFIAFIGIALSKPRFILDLPVFHKRAIIHSEYTYMYSVLITLISVVLFPYALATANTLLGTQFFNTRTSLILLPISVSFAFVASYLISTILWFAPTDKAVNYKIFDLTNKLRWWQTFIALILALSTAISLYAVVKAGWRNDGLVGNFTTTHAFFLVTFVFLSALFTDILIRMIARRGPIPDLPSSIDITRRITDIHRILRWQLLLQGAVVVSGAQTIAQLAYGEGDLPLAKGLMMLAWVESIASVLLALLPSSLFADPNHSKKWLTTRSIEMRIVRGEEFIFIPRKLRPALALVEEDEDGNIKLIEGPCGQTIEDVADSYTYYLDLIDAAEFRISNRARETVLEVINRSQMAPGFNMQGTGYRKKAHFAPPRARQVGADADAGAGAGGVVMEGPSTAADTSTRAQMASDPAAHDASRLSLQYWEDDALDDFDDPGFGDGAGGIYSVPLPSSAAGATQSNWTETKYGEDDTRDPADAGTARGAQEDAHDLPAPAPVSAPSSSGLSRRERRALGQELSQGAPEDGAPSTAAKPLSRRDRRNVRNDGS